MFITNQKTKRALIMREARYYIYKNLTTGTFSIRYKGKVIAHPTIVSAQGITYVVNPKGRERVLREGKKYVHAFVSCDSWQDHSDKGIDPEMAEMFLADNFTEVKYNPFRSDCFTIEDCRAHTSTHATLYEGKVYARKSDTVMYKIS